MLKVFRVLQKEWLIRDTKFRPSLNNACVGYEKHAQANQNMPTFCRCVHHVHALHYSKCFHRFSSTEYQQNTEEKADYDQTEQERDCNWENWARSFQQDIWSSKPSFHVLEAVGWGTAVVSGLHMSHLLYSSRDRQDDVNRCWLTHMQKVVTSVILQRCMEFETGYSLISASVRTMLPRGVFSSLPLPASNVKMVNNKLSTMSVTTDAAASRFSRKDYQVVHVAENGSAEVLGVCDAVKKREVLPFDARSRQSPATAFDLPEYDFKDAIVSWNGTIRIIEALSKNADGVNEAKRGNMEEAIRLWRLAIELSDTVQAHFNLALSYEHGLGIKQDLEKALEHYQYAVERYHPSSLYNSAMIHLRCQHDIVSSKAKAMHLLEKAAEIGSREAQRELGVLYTELPERDMKRAACLFQKAAKHKDVKATYFLGICYENGWGVKCSDSMAAHLYEKAAAGGHADAQFNLGVFYESGKGGLLQDKLKAMELYKMAADHGCSAAQQLMHVNVTDRKLLSDNSFGNTESVARRQQLSWSKSALEFEYHCIRVGHDTNNLLSRLSRPGSRSIYADLVSGSSDDHDIQNKSFSFPGNHVVSMIKGK